MLIECFHYLQLSCKLDIIIIILQMKKLRLRGVKPKVMEIRDRIRI